MTSLGHAWDAFEVAARRTLGGVPDADLKVAAKDLDGDPRRGRPADSRFDSLVAQVDREVLPVHVAVVGEADPDPWNNNERPPPPDTLRDHLRCFLRRSGAYLAWARGQPFVGAPDAFAREVARSEFEVVDVVPVQLADLKLTSALPIGPTCVLVPRGDSARQAITQPAGDGVFFAEGVLHKHVGWFDILVQRRRMNPARLHQAVGEVDGFMISLDFAGARRRFPSLPEDDLEHAIDALRLFDWSRFAAIGFMPDGFDVPTMGARFQTHDSLIHRPFHDQRRRSLAGVEERVDPYTEEEYERRFDILELDAAATAELLAFLTELFQARSRVASVHEWAFVERAVAFVRRADTVDGYEQFVSLIASVEALFGEDGVGLTSALLRRSVALLGGTKNERTAKRKLLDDLYKLRSKHVHGDDAPDPIPGERLVQANVLVRELLVRMLRWLNAVAATSPPLPPPRAALLRYLDAIHACDLDTSAAEAEGYLRLRASRASPEFPRPIGSESSGSDG